MTKTASFVSLAPLKTFALVAQSAEHLHGKEGVIGSSPIEGFIFKFILKRGNYFLKPVDR